MHCPASYVKILQILVCFSCMLSDWVWGYVFTEDSAMTWTCSESVSDWSNEQ